MHELPIVQNIIDNVLKYSEQENAKRVLAVVLEIGEAHDLIDEWVQKYFSFASRTTVAEGAELRIRRIPVIASCTSCRSNYRINLKKAEHDSCPACGGKNYKLLSGDELIIHSIELET